MTSSSRVCRQRWVSIKVTDAGIDYKVKKTMVGGKLIKMEIWDTAGQERFRNITKTYYERAMGVLLVYDCTDERSFLDIRNWIKQLENHAHPNVVKQLVAAKCDSPDHKVETAVARSLASEFNMNFFETSAKLGKNVEQAFTALAEQICLNEIEFKESHQSVAIEYNSTATKKKKRKCC